ncbi:MAG: HlyD family efflux transporter periplasmic adaptor subunit [Oscillospiraceae bacterium]|nr:HlyD family efflux transporter periplasmic adaptor subunit [Oscillospiraceae bacterium]
MDSKERKRGWVKNAVIIFLAIMLLLTFFSNTIMNRSLAQVATQAVMGNSISARIRGQGTVTANAPYEVTNDEARKIDQLLVRVGDKVEVGDVLMTLVDPADDEGSALQQAQDKLEELKYNYRVFLLNMSSADYTRDNRDIAKKREEIQELEAELAKLAVSENETAAAKIAVNSAQTRVDKAKDAVDEAQKALDAFLAANPGASESGDLDALYKAYNAANTVFNAKCLQYAKEYNDFFGAAGRWQTKDNYLFQFPAYLTALYEVLSGTAAPEIQALIYLDNLNSPRIEPITTTDWRTSVSSYDKDTILKAIADEGWLTADEETGYSAYTTAFSEIQTAANALASATEALNTAMAASGVNAAITTQKTALEDALKEANKLLEDANKELEAAQKLQQDLDTRKADYETKKAALETARDALEDMVFELSEKQKSNSKQAQKDQLDLERMKKELEEQEALVERLTNGDGTVAVSQITAKAAGVISDIPANIKSGASFMANDVLMTIDQTDRGYTLSFSVTNEQARKVKVGDKGEVSTNSWWFDGVIDATLTAISNNPQDPRNSRMLIFTVTGDVSSGDQLNISIGERSQNYELVVPKSAIRSDSNGKYVLLLEQKASALGNRYYATRIDVEELASDDTQVAVSGALSQWDYVITSASKPVEAGSQVRLTEN